MSHDLETPKTFELLTPIKAGDDSLTEITLREPTVGDIEDFDRRQAEKGPVTAMIHLIAKQAKLAPADIRNLGARDLNQLQEYLLSFLAPPKSSES